MRRKIFSRAVSLSLLLFAFFAMSCASNKERPIGEFFYDENVGLFREGTLSNGISVSLKHIPFEKNIELRVLFEGGAASCPKGKSGLDQLTLDLIGSSNSEIKDRLARGQYFSQSGCLSDFSYIGFSAAAKDFWDSLAIFSSSLIEERYSHDDYLQKETAAATAALSRSENPRHELLSAVQASLYSSSPYYDGIYYKPQSRVSEYDIDKNLSSLLDAKRMKIIAAGNFSGAPKSDKSVRRSKKDELQIFEKTSGLLMQELESLFGSIKGGQWTPPYVPPLDIKKGGRKEERSEFSGGDYYAALCFECPSRGSDDYEAFALATLALDSVLSRELVEKQKLCSYAGTAVLNSRRSAVLIIASGKKTSRDVFESLQSALKEFPQEYDLKGPLDFYKNIYISRVEGASHNAGATLDQMASGVVYQNGASSFLGRPKKIRGLSVQDVRAAFEKYFLSENSLFVYLSN